MLMSRMREQAMLREGEQVPDTYLLHTLAASSPRVLMPGEELIREGEYGRDLHLVLEGRLELVATDSDGQAIILAISRRVRASDRFSAPRTTAAALGAGRVISWV